MGRTNIKNKYQNETLKKKLIKKKQDIFSQKITKELPVQIKILQKQLNE